MRQPNSGSFKPVPPRYEVRGDTVVALIHSKGQVVEALFDLDDLPLLQGIRSSLVLNKGYVAYAYRPQPGGKQKCMKVYRLIMQCPDGLQVDHINRNKLDNRKHNLRIVTNAQNTQNQKLAKNNTTGVRGVSFHKRNKTYDANIRVSGRLIYLGSRKTLQEAAQLAIAARRRYFPFCVEEGVI